LYRFFFTYANSD